jgi:hypothetical protein
MDRGPSKTIQLQLGAGNTLGRTWVRGLLSARALVLGSRSMGLSKIDLRALVRFKVAKWGVYCHTAWLQISPTRLKQFSLTVPLNGIQNSPQTAPA